MPLPGRTLLRGMIVADFTPPKRPSRRGIILLGGAPALPGKARVAAFLARKGFWVFEIRFRGTWESKGSFLARSPEEDVRLAIRAIEAGFSDVATRTRYHLDIDDWTVIGVSFGGAAAVLAARFPEVARSVALAPVIDWRARSIDEPFPEFVRMLEEGFPGAYRAARGAFAKLARGTFYSPIHEAGRIDPAKLLILHRADDRVVPVAPLRKFARLSGVKPVITRTGGHFSTRDLLSREVFAPMGRFLKMSQR
ncbi:MAG TPA: prolyl oligopeptidase family serine peptidase [Candidatus Paceibacterota bacterium]|nr:prolyl oligopeptidase family serine peptidase [Candidatus Paceibacterota bacterium]